MPKPMKVSSCAAFRTQMNVLSMVAPWRGGSLGVTEHCPDSADSSWTCISAGTLAAGLSALSEGRWMKYLKDLRRGASPGKAPRLVPFIGPAAPSGPATLNNGA